MDKISIFVAFSTGSGVKWRRRRWSPSWVSLISSPVMMSVYMSGVLYNYRHILKHHLFHEYTDERPEDQLASTAVTVSSEWVKLASMCQLIRKFSWDSHWNPWVMNGIPMRHAVVCSWEIGGIYEIPWKICGIPINCRGGHLKSRRLKQAWSNT